MICSALLLHHGTAYELGHELGVWIRCLALASLGIQLLRLRADKGHKLLKD